MTAVSELWSQYQGRLKRILDDLEARLRLLCRDTEDSDPDFHYRFTECRLKDSAGVERALGRTDCTENEFWGVDDLIGVRIVVPTGNDIEAIVARILPEPRWNWERRDIDDPSTGYRGVHLKSVFPGSNGPPVGCEIQVRTILADAWSFLSKEYFHHRGSQPPWDRAMAIMASQLRAADDQLQFIRDQMAAIQTQPDVGSPEVTNDPSAPPSEPVV